jgi:hypothetical protein
MKKTRKTEDFCLSILGSKIAYSKALCNLIISLSENDGNLSVTALSENLHYFYQYSSIRDAIHHFSANPLESKGL